MHFWCEVPIRVLVDRNTALAAFRFGKLHVVSLLVLRHFLLGSVHNDHVRLRLIILTFGDGFSRGCHRWAGVALSLWPRGHYSCRPFRESAVFAQIPK